MGKIDQDTHTRPNRVKRVNKQISIDNFSQLLPFV